MSAAVVSDALEQERVESHLNPPASYDLADHPVPTGREEVGCAGSSTVSSPTPT
jgi:Fe-S cluster assembly protein SufD